MTDYGKQLQDALDDVQNVLGWEPRGTENIDVNPFWTRSAHQEATNLIEALSLTLRNYARALEGK
jgi:hypothetical protein